MKYANYWLSTAALLALLFTFGCGGEEEATSETTATLIGTWRNDTTAKTSIITPSSVPEEIIEELANFSITISATDNDSTLSYRTQNTEELIFPSSGSFALPKEANAAAAPIEVLRNPDNVEVTTSLTPDSLLIMNFRIADPDEGSRTAQVKGEYTFRLANTQ